MTADIALLEAVPASAGCDSARSGMAGTWVCELQRGHAGLHQGRLWGDRHFELETWKVGGTSGCLPPFFVPDQDGPGAEVRSWPARLEDGSIVRLDALPPPDAYRCHRISCWQLQPMSGTASCPACSARICSRCFRCGGVRAHRPDGELAYRSDRSPERDRSPAVVPEPVQN